MLLVSCTVGTSACLPTFCNLKCLQFLDAGRIALPACSHFYVGNSGLPTNIYRGTAATSYSKRFLTVLCTMTGYSLKFIIYILYVLYVYNYKRGY